jgi:hypothetical protein
MRSRQGLMRGQTDTDSFLLRMDEEYHIPLVHVDGHPDEMRNRAHASYVNFARARPEHNAGLTPPIWSRRLIVNCWTVVGRPAEQSTLAWADIRSSSLDLTFAGDSDPKAKLYLYHQSKSGNEIKDPTLHWLCAEP